MTQQINRPYFKISIAGRAHKKKTMEWLLEGKQHCQMIQKQNTKCLLSKHFISRRRASVRACAWYFLALLLCLHLYLLCFFCAFVRLLLWKCCHTFGVQNFDVAIKRHTHTHTHSNKWTNKQTNRMGQTYKTEIRDILPKIYISFYR